MADALIIRGAHPLEGEVSIQGSKNSTLPLIAACLLTEEPCVLERVPAIADVAVMRRIVEYLGAMVEWDEQERRLTIRARHLISHAPAEDLARKFRGSILLAGALLGRARRAEFVYPGGDTIGARPIATHLNAFRQLGVVVEEGDRILLDGSRMQGGKIIMEEPSVTATENVILAAVTAPGTTVITLGAMEPHVQELVVFLRAMGGDIEWSSFGDITIRGVRRLGGAYHRINPDELEISGFAALAAATRSRLTLRNVAPQYLSAVLLQLSRMGVAHECEGETLRIEKPAIGYKSFRIQSGLYPKLGSDHLPPFAVLATQAEGTSVVHDWLYENRLRYVQELQKMGATCEVLDPHRALIIGPSVLYGCSIDTLDIRSGMTVIIAALVAEGVSTIFHVRHLDRGYENLDDRLRGIGADIQREDVR